MDKHILALASTCLFASALYGQTSGIVKGKVVDANDNPLSSVTVSVGDHNVRIEYKCDFSLHGVDKDAVIRYSYLGYQSTSIDYVFSAARREVVIKPVVMVSNEQDINEVEVFGECNKKPKGLEMIT